MAAGKGITKSLVWVLMGLLILGLGGFGVTNLSGTVRSVGSVGDIDIDINEYARTLQNEIRAFEAQSGAPVSFAQAQAAGIDAIVLAQLVARAALDDETRRMGLSIGDQNLRDAIVDIPAFFGSGGGFDRDAYTYSLEQAGLSEARFEDNIRLETARTLLQGAVVSGVNTPASFTDTLISYVAERRTVTWAVLDRGDLATGLDVPTDADLQRYHDAHQADFTSPEIRRISFAWLTPDMLLDTVEVDEDAIQAAYDARFDEFNTSERRLVERLAFADTAAARAAKAGIDAGDSSFETLVTDRGLGLADVDMGYVRKLDLDTAGDAVFAAEVGDIIGPLDSPIGPALYRINVALRAQTTSFEDARTDLRRDLARDRALRVIDAQTEDVDDLLAGGATIEDLQGETEMKTGTIDWHEGISEGIGGYAAFRQAAAGVALGDYPEVLSLDDGGIFALRLEAVIAPALRPLDDVRDQVTEGWRRQATEDALNQQADAQRIPLATGTTFEELGMISKTAAELTRNDYQADTPVDFIEVLFTMEQGGVKIIGDGGRIFVLRLDDVLSPDAASEDVAQMRTLVEDQFAASTSQDLFQALANDIRSRAGISLNQQALNAVHANFQ